MDYLISVYSDIFETYKAVFEANLLLFCVIVFCVLLGIVIAFFNKKYHNLIPWLCLVLSVPAIGTAGAALASLVLYIIFSKRREEPEGLKIRASTLIFPFLAAVCAFSACLISEPVKELLGESAVVGAALAVLFIIVMLDYHRCGKETLYFLIAVREGLSADLKDKVSSEKTYSYTEYPDEAFVDRDTARQVIDLYRQKRFGNGLYGFKHRVRCNDTEYFFDCFDEQTYRKYFDVKKAEYKGKGLTEITALDWCVSDDGKVCVGGGQLIAGDSSAKPEYKEYNGEYVRQAVMYRHTPTQIPFIAEYLETAALILFILTPIGAWIHYSVITAIVNLLLGGV